MQGTIPGYLQELSTRGLNLTLSDARERNKDFEESIISVVDLRKCRPQTCPRCQGHDLLLYGTVQRCFRELRLEGKRQFHKTEKYEQEQLEIIDCLTCKRRFVIHRDLPPLNPNRKEE